MTEPTKLTKAGDALTFTVTGCAKLPFGDYPEVEFTGRDGARDVAVRVPEVSANRQLARLELTRETVVGCTITIKRDPNTKTPTKPYWGIYLEDAGEASEASGGGQSRPAAATTSVATAPAAVAEPALHGSALYAKITAWVLKEIVPQYAQKGIPLSMDGTAAIVATLYIQANRNG